VTSSCRCQCAPYAPPTAKHEECSHHRLSAFSLYGRVEWSASAEVCVCPRGALHFHGLGRASTPHRQRTHHSSRDGMDSSLNTPYSARREDVMTHAHVDDSRARAHRRRLRRTLTRALDGARPTSSHSRACGSTRAMHTHPTLCIERIVSCACGASVRGRRRLARVVEASRACMTRDGEIVHSEAVDARKQK
jgi:hypothetical protein